MKTIPLTQGKAAQVSDEDYEWLSQWKWTYHWRGYAYRLGPRPKRQFISMHRLILSASAKLDVDHIDSDGLNNQRSNLRLATRQQNLANQQKWRGSSRYKGVSWHKRDKCWQAHIGWIGKKQSLGYFDNEEEAAQAYDNAAREWYGKFARLNFPET